jgi:hypothetical protein
LGSARRCPPALLTLAGRGMVEPLPASGGRLRRPHRLLSSRTSSAMVGPPVVGSGPGVRHAVPGRRPSRNDRSGQWKRLRLRFRLLARLLWLSCRRSLLFRSGLGTPRGSRTLSVLTPLFLGKSVLDEPDYVILQGAHVILVAHAGLGEEVKDLLAIPTELACELVYPGLLPHTPTTFKSSRSQAGGFPLAYNEI